MDSIQVISIVRKELKKAGYEVKEYSSVSSKSMYFTIKDGGARLTFRLSDHHSDVRIKTLRFDNKNLRPKHVQAFVNNRCEELRSIKLQKLLDQYSECV